MKIGGMSLLVLLLLPVSATSQLVYLNFDVPAKSDVPATHFEFTLDEQNGTVSYYVKEAEALNKEKAVFGPQTVTWSIDVPFGTLTRTISRVDLSFTQELTIAGQKRVDVGKCSVVKAPMRQF